VVTTAPDPARPAANGPGDPPDWDAVDWRHQEEQVRRLRQRIFKAAQAGDLKQVRNLQKLMLRSRANTLVSVRQASQRNAGRRTPGVDGEVALTSRSRAELAEFLHRRGGPGEALPVRRVYIPKKGGKLRPLGIPSIAERAQQARVRNALEPEWEARLGPRQYGFRPGRGCHDAIQAIFTTIAGKNAGRVWVLDTGPRDEREDLEQVVETLVRVGAAHREEEPAPRRGGEPGSGSVGPVDGGEAVRHRDDQPSRHCVVGGQTGGHVLRRRADSPARLPARPPCTRPSPTGAGRRRGPGRRRRPAATRG
jgi:hypothetical protein